jgi:hypothetical protein
VVVFGTYHEVLVNFVACADVTGIILIYYCSLDCTYVPFHVVLGVFICGLVLDVGGC